MTKAQIWWKILRVYIENIVLTSNLLYRLNILFYARVVITHESSIRMPEVHNTKEIGLITVLTVILTGRQSVKNL